MLANLFRSNISKLTNDVKDLFEPILNEYGFRLTSINKVSVNVFQQTYSRKDDFILISTYDNYMGNVYNGRSSSSDLNKQRWCIAIRLGIGNDRIP